MVAPMSNEIANYAFACEKQATDSRIFIERMTRVFPFAFVVDESLCITDTGHLLRLIFPKIIHHPMLHDYFAFAESARVKSEFSNLSEDELIILRSRMELSIPVLRGQWLKVDSRQMMFIGWPWVTSFGQLSEMGITFSDIPAHNALAEMLMLLQTNRGAMEDARELAATIKQRSRAIEKMAQELKHQAFHDVLTGLPNRLMLRERLQHAIVRAKRQKTQLAVFFIDLDRFKSINDSHGHRIGDKLLESVAVRLRESLREMDTVAREGGDEFLVLIEDVMQIEQAVIVADKLLEKLNQPYLIEGQTLRCGASIGVSIYPDDGTDTDELINHADAAMFDSKGEGRNCVRFFSEESWLRITRRLTMENELRAALEHQQFVVHYQPQVDLPSHRIQSAEALVRWQHPVRGLVSPGEFIPLAEENGMIVHLGEWVLDAVCRQIALWLSRYGWSPSVSVNISARQLQLQDFAQRVEDIIGRHQIPPALIELELTEHSLMQHHQQVSELLLRLKAHGIRLVLDDFGTGYSNLMTLANLPFDTLKIDRSFIAGIAENTQSHALVSMIIKLAEQLKLKVIAEGVESHQQQNLLVRLGCECVQGYLHAPPLTVTAFEAFTFSRVTA